MSNIPKQTFIITSNLLILFHGGIIVNDKMILLATELITYVLDYYGLPI
jgi:hypothetical protein